MDTTVTLRLKKELIDKVVLIAEREDRSRSAVIRRAIKKLVEEEQKKAPRQYETEAE